MDINILYVRPEDEKVSLLPALLTHISETKRTCKLNFDSTSTVKGADEAIMAKRYDAMVSFLKLGDGKILNLLKKKDLGIPLLLLSDVDIDPKLLNKYGIRFCSGEAMDEQAAFNMFNMIVALASEGEGKKEAKALAESLEKRDSWLKMAGELHLGFSKLSDMDELYRALYKAIGKAMPCVSLTVSKYERSKKKIRCELSIVDGKTLDPSKFPPLDLDPKGKGNQSKVILKGKPLIAKESGSGPSADSKSYYFNDKKVLREDGPSAAGRNAKARHTLFLPLYQKGEIDGVLYISSYGDRPYGEDDIKALESIMLQFQPARERLMGFANLTANSEEYESLFQKAPLGYLSLSENGIIMEANETCLGLLGYEDDDMRGKWIGGFLTPASLERFKTDFLRFKSQGHINDARISVIGRNGDTITLSIYGRMDFLDARDELRANCILREVLMDDEDDTVALVASSLEDATALVLLIDRDGVVRHVGGQLKERLGRPRRDLLGAHISEVEQDNPYGDWEGFWQKLRLEGHLAYESSLACRGENPIPVLMSAIHVERDGAEFGLAAATGISVIKRREEESAAQIERLGRLLERRDDELGSSVTAMEEFAHTGAHGLQEPLREASNHLLLFRRKYGKSMGKDAELQLNRAIDGTKRLGEMLSALSAYADIKVDEDAFAWFSALEPIEDAINALADPIRAKKADIRIRDMPEIYADRRLASVLFQNLISNAVEFSGQEERPVVTISHKEENGSHIFSVEDNGIGIDPEHHEDVFKIFSRLGREAGGAGVGLAACKRIVEGHGGRIWIEPRSGKGSTFRFSIPV